ncbi:hypothetical protein BKA64DRAFT_129245 [Cadophora sp. MPI-SDFR-AT-0126]|nr:hypothetical protein BKA64DRAFT_129245 [Leotiomycetes sp. MPI-SDFR-AT-0126]
MNDGTTAVALQHRFRPIKKEAEAMNAGSQLQLLSSPLTPRPFVQAILLRSPIPSPSVVPVIKRSIIEGTLANNSIAIAGQYGDGVTGKAVSTYFERARKEPHWDLTKSAAENGSAKKTPSKRTPAGGKRKAAAMKGEDGDDDEGMAETPSKKAKGARGAAKATPKRANKTAINYTESSDVDDEEGLTGRVKPEKFEESEDDIGAAGYGNGHASQYASNGHGNGHGYYNGNGNGHTMSHDNDGFEDDENFAGQDMYFEANEDEA